MRRHSDAEPTGPAKFDPASLSEAERARAYQKALTLLAEARRLLEDEGELDPETTETPSA